MRSATPNDVESICNLGLDYDAFGVNASIPFYEHDEVTEWIRDSKHNILDVLEVGETIVGFYFCKIMSYHWALLDNFYCLKAYRGQGYGKHMLESLQRRLSDNKIQYVSLLVESDREDLQSFFTKHGFELSKQYVWIDKFIK